jgi:hypothetical protein
VAFRVQIQALDAVKRINRGIVTVTAFNQQYEALLTVISTLAIHVVVAEAKRVFDEGQNLMKRY